MPEPGKAHPEFILLRGVVDEDSSHPIGNRGNIFFTTNHPEEDQTKGCTGETWYEVIGYADTVKEAQAKLYGREYL
jgi:hypothetical protein